MRIEIRIGQVDPELRFVIAQVGIQEVRSVSMDHELEAAQVSRIAMEKTQRFEWIVENIAADVEAGEAMTMAYQPRARAGGERRSKNLKVGADLKHLARAMLTARATVLPVRR